MSSNDPWPHQPLFSSFVKTQHPKLLTMNYFPKSVFFLLAFLAPASATSGSNAHVVEMENLELSVELMSKFHSWVEEHDKSYDSHEEKMKRLMIWVENDGM